MRKIDELGIDTTIRGIKVRMQRDPFAVTAVAGFANPARVDEASGRSLFPTAPTATDPSRAHLRIGSPRRAPRFKAGRGLPVTLSTHAVRFSRCAPYRQRRERQSDHQLHQRPGRRGLRLVRRGRHDGVARGAADRFPQSLEASDITMVGQSIEVPSLGGHGKLYLEAAAQ